MLPARAAYAMMPCKIALCHTPVVAVILPPCCCHAVFADTIRHDADDMLPMLRGADATIATPLYATLQR